MNHGKLKKFAREARIKLLRQVKSRLDYVKTHDDAYLRAHGEEKAAILKLLEEKGEKRLVEEVAYTWFNRVAALRYMDMRRFHPVGIVSPAEGESQIELLSHLKRGMIPGEIEHLRRDIFDYLDGKVQSDQPDREAYKTALLGWCNKLGKSMPFLFKPVEDWAALLLPADLISGESFIVDIQEGMGQEECTDVEIIGWLYQYYISQKKDEVFADLKNNKKITPENIPAATQLFTPHWIVRYMTDNSLGRLWMKNRPGSRLAEEMEYYIPDDPEYPGGDDFLKVRSPEEIRICDPACGSGHMLVYAFDLLFSIYEEEGYAPSEIPGHILEKNLYGIEIDERAGELAAFALTMKAREKDRRFFQRQVQPKIKVLKSLDPAAFRGFETLLSEISGGDDAIKDIRKDLILFTNADNYGSLLRPCLSRKKLEELYVELSARAASSGADLEESRLITECRAAAEQAIYLAGDYHVVIANPPYMGGKGMNSELSAFAKKEYPDSKSDMFAMFIERGFELVMSCGYSSMVTMQSWMFLSSYEKLRAKIFDTVTIEAMVHMANMVMGIAFGTAATVWHKVHKPDYKGAFCYVEYEDIGPDNKPKQFPPLNERNKGAGRDKNTT
jgi:hypothetical protein